MNGKAVLAVAVLAVLAVSSFTVYEGGYAAHQTQTTQSAASCRFIGGGKTLRSQLNATTVGGLTEYGLPGPDRWPNAVTNASDGSIWFAEQELPGVGHFFPGNGTLVEYAWPGFSAARPPDCVPTVSVSGMAVWDGKVWAADEYDNLTVGLNPTDGSVTLVNSTKDAPFPYWLAVGPGGDLWFTSNNFAGQPSRLGRVFPNMTYQAVDLVGLGDFQPIQIDFVNSSFALLAALDQGTNSTTHGCICTGRIYSFDPSPEASNVVPALIGEGYKLVLPTSVTYLNGSMWVSQHDASSVVRYDFATRAWTKYPTSTVPWIDVTLPYVIQAGGGVVWFNEHYANKIAMLNPRDGTLTELSEANPPISSPNDIQNDLSIAAVPGGLWFTSMSGNYLGFASSSYSPGFTLMASGNDTAAMSQGEGATFALKVAGTWSGPMNVTVSDSENYQSIPRSFMIIPSVSVIQPGSSSFSLGVNVTSGVSTPPGNYTIAVTVTDGDIQLTAYLFILVTPLPSPPA